MHLFGVYDRHTGLGWARGERDDTPSAVPHGALQGVLV